MPPIFAIIDLGSQSVRLRIMQTDVHGNIEQIDFLEQNIPLGADTFSQKKKISDTNTNKVIHALMAYKRVITEYDVPPHHCLSLASSAIKEARNRDLFIHKIAIATGITIHVLSVREIIRYLYISYKHSVGRAEHFQNQNSLIYHMGGGNSPFIHMVKNTVVFSHISHFGTLRAMEEIHPYAETPEELYDSLYQEIERRVDNLFSYGYIHRTINALITYGTAITTAAQETGCSTPHASYSTLPLEKLIAFSDTIRYLSAHEISQTYNLPHTVSAYLSPALWMYRTIAKKLSVKELYLCDISLHTGVLLFKQGITYDLQKQSKKAAQAVGEKYLYDKKHAQRVAYYARKIGSTLAKQFHISEHELHLLELAAYLHDIGKFINSSNHHGHSYYLIQNSTLFGLTKDEIHTVALLSKYHRKKYPTKISGQKKYSYEERLRVLKLSAILRIADSLDKGGMGKKAVSISLTSKALRISMPYYEGHNLERLAIRENNKNLKTSTAYR
ncbi:HD domain-containing protein [Chitinivibrio alkaliphilus]|uniref:Ppx/GppA phosphatase n=1 Tax=Chitinivibrio alkaliphilus ACht1 TaxID=1313304 RepID=U7D4K0_9BACT|nr:HD domain-containing protein [Chitinivibrio alkaliphilus]ERP30858.1 Ppx/GppA phosphatase [Chitinivibrio alkaliphilus ACht1]